MEPDSILLKFFLGALGLVMFGLGLSLRLDDFRRLRHHPRAVFIALGLQVILLPGVCYLIAVGFGLSPIMAIGLMLLAASPGGVSANLFSHLFGGNVAMNVSLTAINTMLSIVTLPVIANAAIAAFAGTGQIVPMQAGKLAEVIAVVLIPVALGMAVASKWPVAAARSEGPFKVFSAVVLVAFALIAFSKDWGALTRSFATVGPAVLAFNLVSLLAGYYVSRWAGMSQHIATAIGFEIGIHNSTLAMFIAISVLGHSEAALPAAVYSGVMYATATAFGMLVLRRGALCKNPQSVACPIATRLD